MLVVVQSGRGRWRELPVTPERRRLQLAQEGGGALAAATTRDDDVLREGRVVVGRTARGGHWQGSRGTHQDALGRQQRRRQTRTVAWGGGRGWGGRTSRLPPLFLGQNQQHDGSEHGGRACHQDHGKGPRLVPVSGGCTAPPFTEGMRQTATRGKNERHSTCA